jgi:hypothetical protein
MTERPVDESGWGTVEAHHQALLNLHARTQDPSLVPGFARMATGMALHTLAQASFEDVPVSARVGALGDLARADFPDWESSKEQYLELAGTVVEERGLEGADALLDDLKTAASEGTPFHTLPSGQALPHHEAAFVADDVCQVLHVQIGGLEATWVYSEFVTDADFDRVADWVNPENWPERGPMLFKGMKVVGSAGTVDLQAPPRADEHWHAVFHEEVQLVQRVNTLLHCDYWRQEGRAAGMTYDLTLSLDNEIDVDRGFLSVVKVGEHCHVRALKIVGFTTSIWDQMAGLVCPFWTEWIRAAVEGGHSSTPTPGRPDSGPTETSRNCSWLEPAEEWIEFLGESSRTYVDLVDDMAGEAMSEDVKGAALAEHQRRIFSQLAKDWSQAWLNGIGAVAQMAESGLEKGVAPPDRTGTGAAATTARAFAGAAAPAGSGGGGGTEGTVIPLDGLVEGEAPTVSDLVSIEAGGATIPAGAVTLAVEPLGQGRGVRLSVQASAWSSGLYVGDVTPSPGAGSVPVQLYVSRATGV